MSRLVNEMPRYSIVASLIPLIAALTICTSASANPTAAELNESFELTGNGTQVNVSFLGMSSTEEYNENVHVQWQTGGGWENAPGSWTNEGTEDAESGSGVMEYNKMSMVVSCPAAGTQTIRLSFRDPDDPDDYDWGWGETDVECTGAGPDADDGEVTSCSITRVGGTGSFAVLAAAALGLLIIRRRRT